MLVLPKTKDKCDMKLSKEQVEVLRQCALYAPKHLLVTSFKGVRCITILKQKVEDTTLAPLFENGYLEMTSGNTCFLTDYGRQILGCFRN